jgi:nucleoside-diphosphate-sugar epimerase
MHILLTGAAGLIGSHTLTYLISEGHSVAATDIVPLPAHVLPLPAPSTFIQLDLTDFIPLETFLRSSQPQCEAIIHLGAIPNPLSLDWRTVHNVNVTSNYNILMTAVMLGIKRIVQASSVNAAGLSYTPDDHRMFDTLPMDEMTPMRPEDAYALSKQ